MSLFSTLVYIYIYIYGRIIIIINVIYSTVLYTNSDLLPHQVGTLRVTLVVNVQTCKSPNGLPNQHVHMPVETILSVLCKYLRCDTVVPRRGSHQISFHNDLREVYRTLEISEKARFVILNHPLYPAANSSRGRSNSLAGRFIIYRSTAWFVTKRYRIASPHIDVIWQ